MEDSKLTIVIPVRNRAELLGRTLRSVQSQTLRPLNVVVVDNGSADDSAQVAAKWCEEAAAAGINATLLYESTPGASAARNRGLQAVTTPYVMFFDSDDEMLPGHTRRILDCFEANPDAELIGYDAMELDPDGWTTQLSVADANLMRAHILHGAFSTQRFAATTDLVRRVGGWNETLARWNDLELGVRLLVDSCSTVMIHGDAGVVIHPQEDSITAAGFAASARSCEAAIEAMEGALRRAGREDDLEWTDAKRMVLGALCRREGAKDDARHIEAAALARAATLKKKIVLRLVGLSVRVTGHGGCAIATALLEKPSGERH
jgi:hypothetical protein